MMKIVRDPKEDPMWDTVGISATDFRPHFNGTVVTLWSCINPPSTEQEAIELIAECTRSLSRWIVANRRQFGADDKFQLVVGWPKNAVQTGRQIVKMGGEFDVIAMIADGTVDVVMRLGWNRVVYSEPKNSEMRRT
jgi:hypothetical protein